MRATWVRTGGHCMSQNGNTAITGENAKNTITGGECEEDEEFFFHKDFNTYAVRYASPKSASTNINNQSGRKRKVLWPMRKVLWLLKPGYPVIRAEPMFNGKPFFTPPSSVEGQDDPLYELHLLMAEFVAQLEG